jgi:DNA gyrase/topoisomerase IV subunit B
MAIGLILGEKVDFENLRFTNIVMLADSDVDGGHINTLLTNFFYTYWKELFSVGCIQIAKAPLFEVITNTGKRLFAESQEELLKIQDDKRIIIKEIQRNKGLGEMSDDAWKHLLSKKSYTKLTIKDLEDSSKTLEICFGKDSQSRKDLLLAKNKKDNTLKTKGNKNGK